ncbi:tyrosine-type recombinase/integrase [Streptomyces tanashiensis]|uniref:tyrosine-type recombinase/integrase n=1 Tax=Streptomyces tanashiensis TaxID=67367 RepID=UPI0033C4AE6F
MSSPAEPGFGGVAPRGGGPPAGEPPGGKPLHSDWVSRRFTRLVELSGLPPVRLHDTRHLSAALALLGGAPMKVVQERLGHKSFQITSDTYTTVLPQLLTAEAETTSAVVPRPAQPGPAPTPEKRARGRRGAGKSGADQTPAPEDEEDDRAPEMTRDAVTDAPNEGFERVA